MIPRARSIGVLVLESNDVVATIAAHFLRRAGYHVRVVPSIEQATALLDAFDRQIDVLVCDLELDDMHGQEAAALLQARRPELRVAFICGTNYEAVRRQMSQDEDSPCLGVPFTPSQLLRSVTYALGSAARA
jgi:CheY-like chemotaxis protein